MSDRPFVKLMRTPEVEELMLKDPIAFTLLSIIAIRARRTPSKINGLEIGQAFIGDWKAMGLTQQQYRRAKQRLEVTYEFGTFRGTNKGTIATLVDTRVYDINTEEKNDQENDQRTIKERSKNEPGTTNKKERKKEGKKKSLKGRPSAPETKIDESFSITDRMRGFCRKKDIPDPTVQEMLFEEFRAHHAAKASKYADWEMAFQTWVLRAINWDKVPKPKSKPKTRMWE